MSSILLPLLLVFGLISCCTAFSTIKRSFATSSLSSRVQRQQQQQQPNSPFLLWAKDNDDNDDDFDDDDEYKDPLAKGLDSVQWIGPCKDLPYRTEEEVKASAKTDNKSNSHIILPLFPLGSYVYTPNSEHVLNIFEKRYRQMYSDILMNGSKRFVVTMNHPNDSSKFAKTGVLFELQELKEVSEQTKDKIKYVCSHKVTGRVTIHHILNPQSWEKADTYLKVEGTITYDNEMEPNPTTSTTTTSNDSKKNDPLDMWATCAVLKEEKVLQRTFEKLVDLQHDGSSEETVRFTKASVEQLGTKNGPGPFGIWETVRLWQSFADQRLLTRRTAMQEDFQRRLQEYLRNEMKKKNPKGVTDATPLPSAVEFQNLPRSFQKEIRELEKRMAVELKPLMMEQMLSIQACLEAPTHVERCRLLTYFFDAERKRLSARRTLEGIFGPNAKIATDDSSIPKEELLLDEDNQDVDDTNKDTNEEFTSTLPPPPSSLLADEDENAFQ